MAILALDDDDDSSDNSGTSDIFVVDQRSHEPEENSHVSEDDGGDLNPTSDMICSPEPSVRVGEYVKIEEDDDFTLIAPAGDLDFSIAGDSLLRYDQDVPTSRDSIVSKVVTVHGSKNNRQLNPKDHGCRDNQAKNQVENLKANNENLSILKDQRSLSKHVIISPYLAVALTLLITSLAFNIYLIHQQKIFQERFWVLQERTVDNINQQKALIDEDVESKNMIRNLITERGLLRDGPTEYEQKIQNFQNANQNLQHQVKSLEGKIAESEEKNVLLREQAALLQSSFQTLMDSNGNLTTQQITLQESLSACTKEKDEVEMFRNIAEKRINCTLGKSCLHEILLNHQDRIANIQHKETVLKSRLRKCQDAKLDLARDHDQLKVTVSELHDRNVNLMRTRMQESMEHFHWRNGEEKFESHRNDNEEEDFVLLDNCWAKVKLGRCASSTLDDVEEMVHKIFRRRLEFYHGW